MIVVTGANGALGRAVVNQLLDVVPAEQVGVSVRDPGAAGDLAVRGVRVRRGDFSRPDTLPAAFEDAERVLLVSAGVLGDEGLDHHRAAIAAAVAAGTERVVYTGHMGADPSSPFPPMPLHAATRDVLAASGAAFTFLRHGFYASSAVMLLGDAVRTGELRLPADGPIAWTAHADLAAAAVRALVTDDLDADTAPLTGSEALDMARVAELATELTGRPVRRVVVDDAEYGAALVERGVPAATVANLVGLFAAARNGDFAPAHPALGRLLGRAPRPMREILADAAVLRVSGERGPGARHAPPGS